MAIPFQISFDADDPPALARFWAVALGYLLQPPPDGFDSWPAYVESVGLAAEEVDNFAALIDPDGQGSRLLFQRVPEKKTAKNRIHFDINASRADRSAPRAADGPAMLPASRQDVNVGAPDHDWIKVETHAALLQEAGATLVGERRDELSRWIVLLDPEGNEFCVQ